MFLFGKSICSEHLLAINKAIASIDNYFFNCANTLWDKNETDDEAKVLDKDRFRKDLGRVESAYQQVQQRVLAQLKK